jgi:hypothetical protein
MPCELASGEAINAFVGVVDLHEIVLDAHGTNYHDLFSCQYSCWRCKPRKEIVRLTSIDSEQTTAQALKSKRGLYFNIPWDSNVFLTKYRK